MATLRSQTIKGGWVGPIRVAGVEVYLHVMLLVLPAMIALSSGRGQESQIRDGSVAMVLESVLPP